MPVATDLGQTTAPYPDEGLGMFVGRLLDNGFAEQDVRRMVRDSPAQLLGARTPVDLRRTRLVVMGTTHAWLEQLGLENGAPAQEA